MSATPPGFPQGKALFVCNPRQLGTGISSRHSAPNRPLCTVQQRRPNVVVTVRDRQHTFAGPCRTSYALRQRRSSTSQPFSGRFTLDQGHCIASVYRGQIITTYHHERGGGGVPGHKFKCRVRYYIVHTVLQSPNDIFCVLLSPQPNNCIILDRQPSDIFNIGHQPNASSMPLLSHMSAFDIEEHV